MSLQRLGNWEQKNLEVKTIEYRKSTHLQDPPMQKMKVLAQFYDLPAKILLSKNCQNLAKFFGHFNRKKKKLQIDSKWSKTRKKHETGKTEFLPVAGAGSRWSTNFPCRQC